VSDLAELIDHLGESPVAVGGTSLGAALVMQLSTQIVTSHLVLSRPAFGIDGDTNNFEIFRVLQRIVQERSRSEWLRTLEQTEEFQALAMSAPRNQETYRRLLNHPRLEDLMDWMRALDQEALSVEPFDISEYQGRVDVIGQSHDALHPLKLALDLASLYPNARVHEIASGFASDDEYQEAVRHTLYEIFEGYDYL
jgi:pimeloyl-ACP methyl ester carboxylesterase